MVTFSLNFVYYLTFFVLLFCLQILHIFSYLRCWYSGLSPSDMIYAIVHTFDKLAGIPYISCMSGLCQDKIFSLITPASCSLMEKCARDKKIKQRCDKMWVSYLPWRWVCGKVALCLQCCLISAWKKIVREMLQDHDTSASFGGRPFSNICMTLWTVVQK